MTASAAALVQYSSVSPVFVRPWMRLLSTSLLRDFSSIAAAGARRLASALLRRKGEAAFRKIEEAYAPVSSARSADLVAERILKDRTIFWAMLGIAMEDIGRKERPHDSLEAEAALRKIFPESITIKMVLLRDANLAFREWFYSLDQARKREAERFMKIIPAPWQFNALDNDRIPASIRVALHSQNLALLHVFAFAQEALGNGESERLVWISQALDSRLSRALEFGLGLPGTAAVRDEASRRLDEDLEILEIPAEMRRWSEYMRGARPLDHRAARD